MLKEIKEDLHKWKDICIHGWEGLDIVKRQYSQNWSVASMQSVSKSQAFSRNWQADPKMQGAQNSQNNLFEKEKVGGLLNFKTYYTL